MHSPHLRVTLRCLADDLNLGVEHHGADIRDFCYEHEALRKLVQLRGADPASGEVASGFPSGCKTLHVGRARGLTLWDPAEDVCWLLCFERYHSVGDRKDAYRLFHSLHDRDELLPTADDYEALEIDLEDEFLTHLSQLGRELLDEARSRPSREAVSSLYQNDGQVSICIDIVVFEREDSTLEEGWIGITLPQGSPWPGIDIYTAALALVEEQDLMPAECVGSRARRRNEIAFSWWVERSLD